MSTDITETTPPPFVLSQKIVVTFTASQLLEIALDVLADTGHELDPKSVTSTITKTGMTIAAETIEGKAAPKKRRAKRKTKVAKESVEKPSKEVKNETDDSKDIPATKDTGVNPFETTTAKTPTKEETIAAVKKDNDVPEVAAFSTETTDIVESDSKEAPAVDEEETAVINPFNFEDVGT